MSDIGKLIVGGLLLKSLAGKPTTSNKAPPPTAGTVKPANSPMGTGRLPRTIPMNGSFAGYLANADGLTTFVARSGQKAGGYTPSTMVFGGIYNTETEAEKVQPGAVDQVEAAKKRGELIPIETMQDFWGVAKMIAGGAVVQKTATKPVLTGDLRNWLKTARNTVVFGDVFKAKFTLELAQHLHKIGGCTTDRWKPLNHGIYAHGENKYTVPSEKSVAQLQALLLEFDAIDYAFELAKAEAINAAMRVRRGETNGAARIIAGVAELAGKVAADAAAGLQAGGPWGALVGAIKGAIESAFKQAFRGIAEAQDKVPRENAVLAELDRAFDGMAALVGGVKYPIAEIGYGMNIPNADPPRSIEIGSDWNQWFQRAAQDNIAGAILSFGVAPNWVAQGIYPGPALYAYRNYFGGTVYAWTTDGDDDMGPLAWTRATGYGGSVKVSP